MDTQIIEQVQMLIGKLGDAGDFVYRAAYQRVIFGGVMNVLIHLLLLFVCYWITNSTRKAKEELGDDIDSDFVGFMWFLAVVCLTISIGFLYNGLSSLLAPDWSTIQLIIHTARGL